MSIATLLSQHHQVTAVDIIPEKVDMINNRKSPIQDDYIEKYLAEKELNLTATLDAKAAYSDADFVVIAAPTNYDSHTQHFDTSAVEAVIKLVMEYNPDVINNQPNGLNINLNAGSTHIEGLQKFVVEKAKVDVPFMVQLCGKPEQEITDELAGAIFRNPVTQQWETSDEYLSGNVREKLATAETFAANHAEYQINVDYLKRVQPKDLDASEIEVRLGANWVKPEYITQFMKEVFKTPNYYAGIEIKATYSEISGAWNISGKSLDRGNPLVTNTYGTLRVNGYKLLEDALNLRDTKIYDTIHDADGDHRVLNKQETMLAQQAQESIREAFKQWIFKDLDRREDLCATYNRIFNAIRPREYDGSHIRFEGMTPEISLMPHQKNAVAHILYGKNKFDRSRFSGKVGSGNRRKERRAYDCDAVCGKVDCQ